MRALGSIVELVTRVLKAGRVHGKVFSCPRTFHVVEMLRRYAVRSATGLPVDSTGAVDVDAAFVGFLTFRADADTDAWAAVTQVRERNCVSPCSIMIVHATYLLVTFLGQDEGGVGGPPWLFRVCSRRDRPGVVCILG